jgi:hypothetical protein
MRDNNVPPIPDAKVKGFPSRSEVDAWMLVNPDTALGAVHFVKEAGGGYGYLLQSNSTVSKGGKRRGGRGVVWGTADWQEQA